MKKVVNRFIVYFVVLLIVIAATLGSLSSSSTLITIIIGSVFGGMWLILVIANEIYICWKKRKK